MGKKTKNQERKKKVTLVFDESKRKEFLCGFRKRKLERKKKAQEELQRMLKEERKRIKQENKESYKKLVVSSRPIPDIEQLLQDEYEDEDVNVKIVELSSDTLQKKDLVIGDNRPKEKKPVAQMNKENVTEKITGMDSEEESEAEPEPEEDKDSNLKTKKEIKQLLKKQATKKIQKSKAYQMKNNMERIKNRKKSFHKKSNQAKTRNENTKPNNIKNKKIKKKGKRKH